MSYKCTERQRALIHGKLQEYCVRDETVPGKPIAKYHEGWSDKKILEAARLKNPEPERPIKPAFVTNIRSKLMGRVREPKPKKAEAPTLGVADIGQATEEFVRRVLAKQNPDPATVKSVAAKIDEYLGRITRVASLMGQVKEYGVRLGETHDT